MNALLKDKLKHHDMNLPEIPDPLLLKSYHYNNTIPTFSIIVPVFNQQDIIVKNINSIIQFTGGFFEIIIILDFCYDNTEHFLLQFFDNFIYKDNKLIDVFIYKQPHLPIFEARCDNIGFILSKARYCLEIQADMQMIQQDYNLQLLKPFLIFDNVIAVSGRCCHNFYNHNGIGKLGLGIEKTLQQLNIQTNKFYVYETCNRGPLLFDKIKLNELNYLDELSCPLNDSDHDLMYRASLKGYINGYVPIEFISPVNLGSTRRINNFNNINDRINMTYLSKRLNNSKYGNQVFYKARSTHITKPPQNFDI